MKSYKYLSVITGLFTAVLIISNILEVKLFEFIDLSFMGVGVFNMTAGTLLFPLAYVFGDVLTEVYGYAQSRKVIWTGFLSLLLFVFFSWWAVSLPPADGWHLQNEYETVLNHVPRIVVASIVAYFLGEFTNAYILAKMKLKTKGKNIGLRFITSTFFGQFVDTVVFMVVAFYGVVLTPALISLIISVWLFKVLWEVLLLPITIPLTTWLKKVENEDYFDKKTNFNPFAI